MCTKISFNADTLIVLTTAPAGLGHVRVMEALRSGLSPKTRVAVMGISDPSIQWIHRLTSRHPWGKRLMEFTQENRLAEFQFSCRYRQWLCTHTDEAVQEFTDLVSMTCPRPETIVVLATHFGLAHQLAAVKPILAQKLNLKLLVAVVVTDDSPQQMWAVAGADIIFVPSNTTREKIIEHLLKISPDTPEVITIPYPVSLKLGEQLSQVEIKTRQQQLKGHNLRIMVPVSGAAVQLEYYRQLIQVLTAEDIHITVVSRASTYTTQFIDWSRTQHGVTVATDRQDDFVVAAYEREYMTEVIGAEVTKPSEQAFKALYSPEQRGGSILLLSPPVGRQEKDNLAFLRRHRLIPSVDDQARINTWCLQGNQLHITPALLERAHHWRGIMMPSNGTQAAVAIKRLVASGILAAMGDFRGYLEGHDEIRPDGVKEIWEKIQATLR